MFQYRIDPEGRIVGVNAEFLRFARENGLPQARESDFIGKTLAESITGTGTAHLYEQLVAKARKGSPVRFPFRCDGPSIRRWFSMKITTDGAGFVTFESRIEREEERPAVRILDPLADRSGEFITMCGWCKSVLLCGHWLLLEDSINALGLFDSAVQPQVSHGICDACLAPILSEINEK